MEESSDEALMSYVAVAPPGATSVKQVGPRG